MCRHCSSHKPHAIQHMSIYMHTVRLYSINSCTFMSGTKSGPKGVSTLIRVFCTFHVPRNCSGKVKSEGPPPREDHALSTASGSRLA